MPLKQRGQIPRRGYHERADILKSMRPAMARDDLRSAYAGDENNGKASSPKTESLSSTKLKGRRTKQSKTRTPIR